MAFQEDIRRVSKGSREASEVSRENHRGSVQRGFGFIIDGWGFSPFRKECFMGFKGHLGGVPMTHLKIS